MDKKKRTSKVAKMQDDSDALEQTISKATERTAAATGQPIKNEYQLAAEKGAELLKRSNKRKDYETDKGRKRYNTMIHPDLKQRLNVVAKGKGITVPDLIEEILCNALGIEQPGEG